VSTQPVDIYLGLGSNLGSREDNLKKAIDEISHRLKMIKVSSIYDTAPIGDENQPRYLNMVCEVFTTLPPPSLMALLQGFELKLGRLPAKKNAPRPIDIDILIFGTTVLNTPELTIPHPRMAEREFVLAPFAEIAPDIEHPVLHKTIKQLYITVAGQQNVHVFEVNKGS
jgi:2-amino-4-hydroxy-6-hydroxymethyldihydropteridine diphosphokinase